MIIIEGCDNTGKTTLIGDLRKMFLGLQVRPKSPGPARREELLHYVDEHVRSYGPKDTLRFVFDRFPYFSEQVYGEVLRGKVALNADDLEEMKTLLWKHNPLVIYCNPPLSSIVKTFGEREQLEGVWDNLEKIRRKYPLVIERSGASWISIYDYTQGSLGLLALERMIFKYVESRIQMG